MKWPLSVAGDFGVSYLSNHPSSQHHLPSSSPYHPLTYYAGPQPAYKQLRGVKDCVVGYAGGTQAFPTYERMMDHTEAVLVEYDPEQISYREILQEWKRLGGTPYPSKAQYRSALFVLNDEQRDIAQDYTANIEHVDVEKVTKFYRAEERHQDFLRRMG
jgi:peptide-methionine (S)-S-oxide reductase